MDYNSLKYIITVNKHRSISKAADELFLTQPNISKAIQNVEKEIGFQIFTRTSRGVATTIEGKDEVTAETFADLTEENGFVDATGKSVTGAVPVKTETALLYDADEDADGWFFGCICSAPVVGAALQALWAEGYHSLRRIRHADAGSLCERILG